VCLSSAALLFGSLLAGAASADTRPHRDDRFRAVGRVIDVRPVYGEVAIREPRRHCDTVYEHRPNRLDRGSRLLDREPGYERDRYRRHEAGVGGAIVGGVIGGTIGNRIARHRGSDSRTASTLAGVVVGSTIGHSVSQGTSYRGYRQERPFRHDRPRRRPVQRCYDSVTTRYETRLQHYDVTYVFRGRTFHATRPNDPGDSIEIDVSVRPSER